MTGQRMWMTAVLWTAPVAAWAQSPITIEQLLVKPARWQLTSSLQLQTGESVPGYSSLHSAWGTGLRYGISPQLEINTRIDQSELTRYTPAGSIREQGRSFSAGFNWLLLRETRLPALLLQARTEIYSSTAGQTRSLPSVQLGFTTYKSIDPIVLSLFASLQHERDSSIDAFPGSEGDVVLEPGLGWHIEPAINFAVNPQITLLGAMSYSQRSPLQIDGVSNAVRERQVALRLGVGYAPVREHSIFLSAAMTSDAGGGLNLRWFWEF